MALSTGLFDFYCGYKVVSVCRSSHNNNNTIVTGYAKTDHLADPVTNREFFNITLSLILFVTDGKGVVVYIIDRWLSISVESNANNIIHSCTLLIFAVASIQQIPILVAELQLYVATCSCCWLLPLFFSCPHSSPLPSTLESLSSLFSLVMPNQLQVEGAVNESEQLNGHGTHLAGYVIHLLISLPFVLLLNSNFDPFNSCFIHLSFFSFDLVYVGTWFLFLMFLKLVLFSSLWQWQTGVFSPGPCPNIVNMCPFTSMH